MVNKKQDLRINVVYLIFVFLFIAIAIKISYLQIFRSNFFKNLAKKQHYRLLRIAGNRGTIFDRRNRELALGINQYSVFADPAVIDSPEGLARILSGELGLEKKSLVSKLNKNKRFVWVKRKISLEAKESLEKLKLKGVNFLREEKRFYPQGGLASSVLGIVDIDNKGLEGLELRYDDYLRGKDGMVRVLQDSASKEIPLSSQIIIPQKGADVVLNLDAQVQYWVEEALEKTIKDFDAKKGSMVVMDAFSGGIIALANYPSFNPNKSRRSLQDNIKNNAIADMFEPGSVFKVITLMAAVNEKKFSNDDIIFCENGKFKIPGTILNDWKPYGDLTFREVFMKSSNIGVVKIVDSLGAKLFFNYIRRFGFGKITGIDLPGETPGSLKDFSKWSRTSPYIIPIGQEIGVNLLQLARAFAVVANGGYLVKPYLVKSICSQNYCRGVPIERKKILALSVADKVKDILIDVVGNGTGKRAAIKGRKIGGKTGTAQKYDPKIKRYSPTKYRATFVGFVADLNPPLVIGVTIDEPRKSHFGGVVAAPAFRDVAEKVIKYLSSYDG